MMQAKKKILVVEDEGLIAANICSQLERLGYAVPATADTGEDALRLARSTPFDLVLMDIRIKGDLDGIATARILHDELQTPVVYLTAHADQETVDRATVTEPLGYIVKPVTDGDLRSAVQVALYKHEMEKRLRASQMSLATTLRSVGEGILATDTSGEIVFMNRVAEQLTGWSEIAAYGRPIMDVLSLFDEAGSRPANNPIFELADGVSQAYTLLSSGGIAACVEIECCENRFESEVLGAIVVVRDIGARREMEARLMQTERMEAIAAVAGGLSHDFNNQLTVILGNAAELCSRLDGECREEAQAIHTAATAAASLTAQLIVLSRRDVPRPELLNVDEVLRELRVPLTQVLGSASQLLMDFHGPSGFIHADRNQFRQVLINLALNARDGMPSGGELRIESGTVEVGTRPDPGQPQKPGPYVRLCVTDTGKGRDPSTLARIFEPFFTGKAADAGNGLGLSIAHSIVTRCGGAIRAASEPGGASCFEILLPSSGACVESDLPGSPTILLVEDEDGVRRLMRRYLEREGYQLLETRTAEEAEALAEVWTEPIHLLITGVILPGMTGTELADRLARQRPGIRSLFVSGYRHDTLKQQGLLDRRLNFLCKPFPAAELLRRVRALLLEEGAAAR